MIAGARARAGAGEGVGTWRDSWKERTQKQEQNLIQELYNEHLVVHILNTGPEEEEYKARTNVSWVIEDLDDELWSNVECSSQGGQGYGGGQDCLIWYVCNKFYIVFK